MILHFLLKLVSASITGPVSPMTAVDGTPQTLSWTLGMTAVSDCTLSSYNGEISLADYSGFVSTYETYVANTYYQRIRFTAASDLTFSVTYQTRTYHYLSDILALTGTDYLELVCNDGADTAQSTTIIGINGGWTPQCQTDPCNGQGNCDPYDNSCTCYYPYFGTNCENKDCGYCHNSRACDTSTGTCNCGANYYGTHCEYVYCPYPSNSDGCNHGYCDIHSGKCTCYEGYEGYNCNKKKCLNDCNEGGVCDYDTGTCTCYLNYLGTDCAYKKCSRDCGAYGGCNYATGECRCYGSYSENDCQFTVCPGSPVCSEKGVCNYYSGICDCFAGYVGVDCSSAQ